MDILIRNALLRGSRDTVDLGISGKRISGVGKGVAKLASEVIDAEGRLVLPTFVDPHMHLDKAFVGGWAPSDTGSYANEILKLQELKKYHWYDVRDRAERAVLLAVSNGVTKIRTNVDVDTSCGLTGLDGVLAVKKKLSGIADVQIVAFPSQGILVDPGAEELIWKAMERGADVVGGIPRLELDEADSNRHTDKMFAIAKHFDADIDMHIDAVSDSQVKTILHLAAKTIREDYQGRVTAGHMVALSYYNEYEAERTINLVKQAGINVVTCPATTMMSGSKLDKEPRGRGVTRIRQLINSGVCVSVGQDNIQDVYNPFGDADPLTNAFLAAYAGQLSSDPELETLMDMITLNPARALRLKKYGISRGNEASLTLVNAKSVREALARRSERLKVIHKGEIVASTSTDRTIRNPRD